MSSENAYLPCMKCYGPLDTTVYHSNGRTYCSRWCQQNDDIIDKVPNTTESLQVCSGCFKESDPAGPKSSSKFTSCSFCGEEEYCSVACQEKDFKRHSETCLQSLKKIEVCGACSAPNVSGNAFKVCSNCKSERYCSKECQRVHWGAHKEVCMTVVRDRVFDEECKKILDRETIRIQKALGKKKSFDKLIKKIGEEHKFGVKYLDIDLQVIGEGKSATEILTSSKVKDDLADTGDEEAKRTKELMSTPIFANKVAIVRISNGRCQKIVTLRRRTKPLPTRSAIFDSIPPQ